MKRSHDIGGPVPRPTRAARRPGRRGSAGQTLVEFAMVAPLLLLFIIGIFDIGRLVYINNALAQAAREGARYGSVQGRSSDPEAIRAHVLGAIAAVPAPVVNVTCSPTCRPGSTLAVEVETSVAPVTPLISQFVGPIDLSSTSTMGIHL